MQMEFPALSATQKEAEGRLALYRCTWFVFMVFVFAPAWMWASSVEGVSFDLALGIVKTELNMFACPDVLANVLKYPITVLATIIPGSSRFALFPLLMFMGSYSLLAAFVYFALVRPPFYREMKLKADILWEIKEEAKWVVKPKFKGYVTFGGMVWFILWSSLIGEVMFGFLRPSTADSYEGNVYLLDRQNHHVPLNVTLKLDIISPGVVFDVKPGVYQRSMHIKFEGKDLAVLQKLGIDPAFFGENVDKDGYGTVVCDANDGGRSYDTAGYSPYHSLAVSEWYKNTNGFSHRDYKCPKEIRFGMEDLTVGQFAIADISRDYIIVADITRQTRWSPIQYWIMQSRYHSDTSHFYKNKS
jgi:hypothetical protein